MENRSVSDCPFCEPQSRAISYYSDVKYRAIYNRSPILPGHSLVIPKSHIESVNELTDTDLGQMMVFARHVAENLMRIFTSTAFNWTIQDGAAAGQTVPHLHLHLIPRADGDLAHPGDWYPRLLANERGIIDISDKREWFTDEELLKVVKHIRSKWDEA